jgi:hypothetical protein
MTTQDLKNDKWIILPLIEYKAVPTSSGVYCLLLEDTVIYVGKSKCLFTRICSHRATKKGKFNFIAYKLYLEELITEMERFYIRELLPLENINGVGFSETGHISIKNIFRHNYSVGDMMGHSYSYVRPFRNMKHLEEILDDWGYSLYEVSNRICINPDDRKDFINIVNRYIAEYVRGKMSSRNFFKDNPPRLICRGEDITVEQFREYVKEDTEIYQEQNRMYLEELKRYRQALERGEISI